MNPGNRPEPTWTRLLERLTHLGSAAFTLIVIGVVIVSLAMWNSSGPAPQPDQLDSDERSAKLPNPVRALSLSSDGQFVDVLRGDSTWRRHDAHTGCELVRREIQCPSQVHATVRGTREVVVSAEAGNRLEILHPFQTLTLEAFPNLQPGERISRCAVARDRNLVAVISEEGSLWLLEFDDEEIHSVRHNSIGERLGHVAVSPDGRFVALASAATQLLIWDVQREQIVSQQRDEAHENQCVQWSDDGTTLITFGINSKINIWDAQTLTLLRQFQAVAQTVITAAISAAGRTAAAGDGELIRVWDVKTGQEIASLPGHQAEISALQIGDHDRALFSADLHGELRRWSLLDGREIWCVQ